MDERNDFLEKDRKKLSGREDKNRDGGVDVVERNSGIKK